MFICGGAFDGLDKIIQRRIGEKTIGFNSDMVLDEKKTGDILKSLQPEDLLKFGLIPEFIGRLPAIVTLNELSENALVRILTEPKNALVKQYRKLFEMENVELEIEEDALKSIASEAIERKTGARGLRGIIEKIMTDVMFEIPSEEGIVKCIVTKESVTGDVKPFIIREEQKPEGVVQ